MLQAVTDGRGGSFFADAPEMLSLAREKIARPLFAALVRVAAGRTETERASEIARGLGAAFGQFTDLPSSELVPLSRDGDPSTHVDDPILTRLNSFLRHRLVRHVIAQRDTRFDVGRVMNEGKIFLAKLAQGQIGEENARVLGKELFADADDARIRLLLSDGLIWFLDEIAAQSEISDAGAGEREVDTGKDVATRVTNATKSNARGQTEPPDKKRLLIAKDAAAYLGLATQTLAKLRVTGGSPAYFKVGRQVMYDRAELDAWLAKRRRRNTSEDTLT